MNNKTVVNPHWSFWLTTAVMLVWNVLGCVNFFAQMNPDTLALYRESERIIIQTRPLWVTGTFALAVFGGSLGCLLLLFRKSVAYYLFIVSLLGVIMTMIHTLNIGIDFSAGEIMGIILMPLAVAVFLIWYSKYSTSKQWVV